MFQMMLRQHLRKLRKLLSFDTLTDIRLSTNHWVSS